MTVRTHIRDHRNERVGVDASCWLHKGVYSCAREICLGIPTHLFVTYCMRQVNILIRHGITPILVFDGDALPMKKNEEARRHADRGAALAKAKAFEEQGDRKRAMEFYNRAVDVTPEMSYALMLELKRHA